MSRRPRRKSDSNALDHGKFHKSYWRQGGLQLGEHTIELFRPFVIEQQPIGYVSTPYLTGTHDALLTAQEGEGHELLLPWRRPLFPAGVYFPVTLGVKLTIREKWPELSVD